MTTDQMITHLQLLGWLPVSGENSTDAMRNWRGVYMSPYMVYLRPGGAIKHSAYDRLDYENITPAHRKVWPRDDIPAFFKYIVENDL